MGVELGDLTGGEDDVVLAEQQPQSALEDVEPFVAFVAALFGRGAGTGWQDDLVSLDAPG